MPASSHLSRLLRFLAPPPPPPSAAASRSLSLSSRRALLRQRAGDGVVCDSHRFKVALGHCDVYGGARHINVYHVNRGATATTGGPCVLYVPGFMRYTGDVEVRFVVNHCLDSGYECIAYDPEG